jgi:hypothetical protein
VEDNVKLAGELQQHFASELQQQEDVGQSLREIKALLHANFQYATPKNSPRPGPPGAVKRPSRFPQ